MAGIVPRAPAADPPGSVPDLPGSWAYRGCYIEGSNGRALNLQQQDNDDLTIESCVDVCIDAGYRVAGLGMYTKISCAGRETRSSQKYPLSSKANGFRSM